MTSIAHSAPTPLPLWPRIRRTIPWTILLLGVASILFLQLSDKVEGNFKGPFTALVVAAVILLLTIWVLALSGFRAKTRLIVFALELVIFAGVFLFVKTCLKWRGSWTGAGWPRLVWKWTPEPDAGLKPLSDTGDAVVEKVDLTTTTPIDFPEFLGPGGHNQLAGVGLWRDWSGSHAPQLLWRQPVGLGWGSFAVVNGFAITQEQRGDRELVTCLEAKTGKIRWQHSNTARFSESMGGDGPRATPTIRDGRVYVMGATGILECLDGATGHAIWSRNIFTDSHADNPIWGKSCSPLIYGNLIVVSGGKHGPSLLAFDRETGSPRWTGGADSAAYASPAPATVGGVEQILILNAHSASGHNPANGNVLWQYGWPGDFPKVAQVLAMPGDRVFISAGYGLGSIMLHLAPTGDGAFSTSVLWKSLRLKTEMTNVAVRDGFIYGLDDSALTCLEADTGNRRWRGDRYGHGQILLVDDLIIVQAEEGNIALVAATPDSFQELGSFPVFSSKTWNNPALYGHELLVRNDREMAAFMLP